MSEPQFLIFATQAELTALWGAVCLVAAGLCSLMERRRARRARINDVGWMPWTSLFLAFAVTGGGLLAVSVPAILKG